MTWANIPPGDAGDLSAGSRSESCLPPRVGWQDRCLRWGGGPRTEDPGPVAAAEGGGRESKAACRALSPRETPCTWV